MRARRLWAVAPAASSAALMTVTCAGGRGRTQREWPPPGYRRPGRQARPAGSGQAPWPEFGGDATWSEVGVSVPVTAGSLHKEWVTPPLDGAVYSQPLVAGGCLFVATGEGAPVLAGGKLWGETP